MSKLVGIFIDQLVPGSSPKIAGKEVRYLNKLGVNTELLLIKQGIPTEYQDFLGMIKVRCLEDRPPRILKMSFKFPGFSFFSSSHVICPIYAPFTLKRKYDILITHFTYTCFTAYALKKFRGIPYVAFIHDPTAYVLRKVYTDTSLSHFLPILTSLGAKTDKLIADSAEMIILPSKYHLDLIKKLTRTPVKIIPHGVEPIKKIPSEREDFLISVARWEQGKNPFFLMDVLGKLKRKGHQTTLVMIGSWKSWSLRAKFIKEAKRRNLSESIKLRGPVEEEELKRFYLKARALVHSISEAFGMVGLEAAAHGCPFMIPKGSGVTDLFTHGVHGFFPEEGNVEEYAECLDKLVSNKRLAWKIGSMAWEISKKYTWEKHAWKLAEVIEAHS